MITSLTENNVVTAFQTLLEVVDSQAIILATEIARKELVGSTDATIETARNQYKLIVDCRHRIQSLRGEVDQVLIPFHRANEADLSENSDDPLADDDSALSTGSDKRLRIERRGLLSNLRAGARVLMEIQTKWRRLKCRLDLIPLCLDIALIFYERSQLSEVLAVMSMQRERRLHS